MTGRDHAASCDGDSADQAGHSDHGHGHGGTWPALSSYGSINGAPDLEEAEKGGHDDHCDHGHGSGGHVDHNMWGLFVHFLGDVFTSLLVLAVGLIYLYHDRLEKDAWGRNAVKYADPAASVLSAIIIVMASKGLVKSCAWVLMQAAPDHVDIARLLFLVSKVDGVMAVHELHVWQLVDSITVATVHVVIHADRGAEINAILESIRATFHKFDIHVSTIQPELVSQLPAEDLAAGCVISGGNPCAEECGAEPCCPDTVHEQNEFRRRKYVT